MRAFPNPLFLSSKELPLYREGTNAEGHLSVCLAPVSCAWHHYISIANRRPISKSSTRNEHELCPWEHSNQHLFLVWSGTVTRSILARWTQRRSRSWADLPQPSLKSLLQVFPCFTSAVKRTLIHFALCNRAWIPPGIACFIINIQMRKSGKTWRLKHVHLPSLQWNHKSHNIQKRHLRCFKYSCSHFHLRNEWTRVSKI